MMPFEFVLQLTIVFLGSVLDMIMKLMELLAWLKKQLGGIMERIYETIVNFIVPIIEMIMYLRDMLGKINGVIVTALYTIVTIYSLTLSGLVNILTILINILITMIVIIVLLMLLSALLFLIPFSFAAAVSIQLTYVIMLVGVVLPALIICVLLHNEIKDSFNESSPSPPQPP
jgi:hypothetical protein